MRADRLVAILLLLQARGQVTAAEVAAELEVSERTARRDLEALGTAGLPIYSRPGRNGGWQLAGGGRTDLSGLTAPEARALFLVAGPSSAATPEVKAALRKLVRALPEPFRESAQTAAAAVVVDPAGWGEPARRRPPPQHLEAIQRAVVDGEQIELGYVARDRSETNRVVHPLGLAAKGSVWYLVADTDAGLRTFRVDRVASVLPIGAPVVRPEGFELADAWRLITDEVDERRAPLRVRALATPDAVQLCRWRFGTRVRIGPADTAGPGGRVEVELRGQSVAAIASVIAGFGSALEVLEPPEVRARLAHLGGELGAAYRSPPRLVLLCGLPGSGKTTTARRIVGDIGAVRLCPDEWMALLGIDLFDEPARARVEALQWELAQELLRLGQHVIIEWGVWSRSERDTVRTRARELGARVELVYLDVPIDMLWERLRARNLEPGQPVIERDDLLRWAELIEPPGEEEQALFDPPDPPGDVDSERFRSSYR